MGFKPISIEKYLELYFKSNPKANIKELRKKLSQALMDSKKGIKCKCGNDIWVIGSASVGNSCFTCITGESYPNEDFEIDAALKKNKNKEVRRHIDKIDKTYISGYFDDDGFEINMDMIQKPSICLTCKNDDNPDEEILCNVNRHDQRDESEFKCFAYIKK